MGNKSCTSSHNDMGAVGAKMGQGGDLDQAVLAAATMSNQGPSQRLSLSFSAKGLPNLDTMSKSDPFLVLKKKVGNMWQKIGQTEVIHDNLNPEWVTKIQVQYNFEVADNFRVEIYDIDDEKNIHDLSKQELCGGIDFQLHEVVTCTDQLMTKKLANPKRKIDSKINVTAEEINEDSNREVVIFTPDAQLKEHSGLYFFIIYKEISHGRFQPVYKSEVKKPNDRQHMYWNQVQIGTTDLCKDDHGKPIKFEFYRSDSSGKHKNVGHIDNITLGIMREGQMDHKIQKSGQLKLAGLKIEAKHSFLEYVFGGCHIDFSIAIDFTLSNGDPRKPNSLHYFDQNKNQYLQVINQVGTILQFYNTDKQINLYGFGGAVPPYNKKPSHCFAMNGNILNPRVNGIDQAIAHYRHCLNNVNLYGPTMFHQIIAQINDQVASSVVNYNNQRFHILLIITDGIINDMAQTIDEIVRGSATPMAIIIVGVGDADFDQMEQLDGDDEALYSQRFRKYVEADIVQFVPFNRFKQNPEMLAKETLMELPGQLLKFMRTNGISPMPRSEMERHAIKSNLETKAAFQPGYLPQFFATERDKMISAATQQGCDVNQAINIVDTHGIWARDMNQFMDVYRSPNMSNPLLMYPLGQQSFAQQMAVNPVVQNMAAGMKGAFNLTQQQPMQMQTPMLGQPPMQGKPPMQGQPGQGYAYYDPNAQQP